MFGAHLFQEFRVVFKRKVSLVTASCFATNGRFQSFSVLRDHVNPHLQLASGVERSIRFRCPQCSADAGDRCWHTPGVDE